MIEKLEHFKTLGSFDRLAPRLLGAAIVSFGAAYWKYSEARTFLDKSETVHGTVVENIEIKEKGITHAYRARIRYQTADGKDLTVLSSSPSFPAEFSIGDAVDVAYPAHAPEKARIVSFWQMWFTPILAAAMGGVFLAIWFMI